MKKKMDAPWVRWSYGDFLNGVVGLDAATIGVYTVIINMIYDNGGPLRSDDHMMRKIARRVAMRYDHFTKVIETLIREEKLVVADGVISNARAERELGSRADKVAKLVSNLKVGKSVQPKNGNHFSATNGQMGTEKQAKNGIDKTDYTDKTDRKKPAIPVKQKNARIDPRRKLSDQNVVFARSRGLTRREIDHEWMAFVRYYAGLNDQAKNARSPDWDVVWESWCLRKAAELGREPLVDSDHPAEPVTIPREVWMNSIEIYRSTGQWHPDLGPPPDKPGYRGPPDLVRPS